MPILKKEERKEFTQIPNDLLRQSNMTLAAKGLLCYMLSCSDEWKFSIKGLSSLLGETEYKIQKCLAELEELGYHKKEAVREEGKIIEWKYFVSDTPILKATNAGSVNQEPLPIVVKPKKKNLFQQCVDVIEEEYIDTEVKEALKTYLDVRIRQGRLSAKSWRSLIKELRGIAGTKEEALEVVRKATHCGYMKLYPVTKYKKKNSFVDDIQPVLTDDFEGILKQKYISEFSMIPKCDRPDFDTWRKEQTT